MIPELYPVIDQMRRSGHSYDDVVAKLEQHLGPKTEAVVKAYAQSTLPDGRRRGQVNLGEPQ